MENPISYKSKFNNKILVVLLDDTHEKYNEFRPMFKQHGLAFLFDNKYIFVDQTQMKKQGYGKHHLKFVEAHEIAHFKLKHGNRRGTDVEAEADYIGILLCLKMNFNKAAKIGISYFRKRNNVSFEEYKKTSKLSLK